MPDTPDTPTKPRARTVRTDVPPDVFAALEDMARRHGTTIAAEARAAITAYVGDRSIPTVTKRQWEHTLNWLAVEGLTPLSLKRVLGFTKKYEIVDWAKQQGMVLP